MDNPFNYRPKIAIEQYRKEAMKKSKKLYKKQSDQERQLLQLQSLNSDNYEGSNRKKSNTLSQYWKDKQFDSAQKKSHFGCTNIIFVGCIYYCLWLNKN